MKGFPLVLLILTVGAVGCDESPTGPTAIVDVTWKLETVARVGSAIVTVPNPEQFTVRFESNNRLAVRADCNTCTGTYTLDGSSVSISPTMACTLIACPTPGVDTLFTSALQNARTVTVSNDNLIMTGSEFTLRFRN